MTQQTSRPNVIFVFADEWRAQATGYAGDNNCETPVMDELSRNSLNLTHAVSGCSVCCPYRGSLLTGQYPLTHGIFINDVELSPKSTSIADAFKAGGYDTSYIGKWHVYGSPQGKNERRAHHVPRSHQMGFDEWRGFECSHNHLNSGYFYNDDPTLQMWGDYDAFAQTREAVRQLKSRDADGAPLMQILSWGPPHFPLNNAPEAYRKRYEDRIIELRDNVPEHLRDEAQQHLRGYYAHIAALDHAIDMLLQGIAEAGMADNTILVITSDHGDMRSSQALQTKCFPFDESIRVPFLIRGPGIHAGELTIPIDAPDIMPSLLGLCGLNIPDSVEGRDWSPEILGQVPANPDDAAFLNMSAEFTELQFNDMRPYRGLRNHRYTYVRNTDGPWLLFDNEVDPYQKNNIINDPAHAALQDQLEKQLQHVLHQRGDEFLDSATYFERAGYTHYRETQCEPRQIWRDPWKTDGPIIPEGAPPYIIA